MRNYKNDRLYQVSVNNNGTPMKIVEYVDANNMKVQFQDSYECVVNTRYERFLNGKVGNPYDKTVCGIGFVGIGKHSVCEDGKVTLKYRHWAHMLERCVSDKYSWYNGVSVCDKWSSYQEFGDWFDENYYTIEGCNMQLDKDIIVKGNKVYSPNTCIFVPSFLNAMFTKSTAMRGVYPIGVTKSGKKYCASLNKGGFKRVFLGVYDTTDEAFGVYKKAKESYIKEVADKYKELIPNKLYEALYNYEVEITD